VLTVRLVSRLSATYRKGKRTPLSARRIGRAVQDIRGFAVATFGEKLNRDRRDRCKPRGGDAYGWRRDEVGRGAGSNEKPGFRTDLGAKRYGPSSPGRGRATLLPILSVDTL